MNREERFHELAQKTLASEAAPAEQAELDALLAEDRALHDEFQQLRAEAAAAREILPLLRALEQPGPTVPRPPIDRLRKEVRKVFSVHTARRSEAEELLSRLEQWATQHAGSANARVQQLIELLRQSVAPPPTAQLLEQNFLMSPIAKYRARLMKEREFPTTFEARLHQLERHIIEAERITHECRQDVLELMRAYRTALEAMHQGKESQ